MNITWQHQDNIQRMQLLKEQGYTFDITADGYSVSYKGKFLGGASVMLPRSKPLHWRHRAANRESNLEQALLTIDRAKVFDKIGSVK